MNSDTVLTALAIALSIGVFLLLGAGLVAIVVGTIMKKGIGINFSPIECPECGAPAPAVRTPANFRQTLWGGCTCAECGCEYDKWGRRVES